VTDDLGLGLEPERQTRPNYLARRLGVTVGALVIIAALALVGLVVARGVDGLRSLFGAPADYSGSGFGSVVVQIHDGDTLSRIGQELKTAGVVRSVGAFTKAASENEHAATIGPGFYRLRRHMKASLAVALLLDPKSLVASRVVVPEGMQLRDILTRVAKETQISSADLQRAAASPASLGVPSWGRGHPLEGFLFPATYDFAPDTTASQALSAMVARFNQAASQADLLAGARRLGYTPYQVLTLASIVQHEGRLDSDFPRIAEVFYNRLHRDIALGSDATLIYALGHGGLTNSDLKNPTPYNTRLHKGFPPTPIDSPGDLALAAALHPSSGNLLYFVTIDKAGHTAFATTDAQFQQLVAESRRNGVR
jgi:UPF0755 protein